MSIVGILRIFDGSGHLTDSLSKNQRSHCMSRIRSKDTLPELRVRKELCRLGIHYRLHVKNILGNPDIVIRKKRLAIFVNGCFWHQHEGCKRATNPKSNQQYWQNKLQGNAIRQKDVIVGLEKMGWRVGIVWECDNKVTETLHNLLKETTNEV